MNIKTILLVITIIVLVLFTTGAILNNHNNNTTTQEQRENTLTGKMLMEEFTRIHNLPYEQYQCREKADLLKTYIHEHQNKYDIYTVSLPHTSGEYSHVYVLFNNRVYDPTSIPPLYNKSPERYQMQLEVWGFNTHQTVMNGYDGV